MKTKNLVEITHWCHVALAEILSSGDLAVDLTVGNGNDTLFLYNIVGPEGNVVGFDIQMVALESTRSFLESSDARVKIHPEGSFPEPLDSGTHLFQADHVRFTEFLHGSPKAVIANLGYLPGGDHGVVTQTPTTIAALAGALEKLLPGGRLAVVCYVEHAGGREEAEAVEKLFADQAGNRFHVLRINNSLAAKSPFLLVA